MKKIVLSMLMIAATVISANAQKTAKKKSPIADIESFSFYGIDYSQGRVFGASDEPEKLKKVFGDINMLFVNEADKYDLTKLTGKKVNKTDIMAVSDANKNIPADNVKTLDGNFSINDLNITTAVHNLKISDEDSGVGFVMIAQLLNKATQTANYQMVFFDVKTRNIVTRFTLTGEAGGFGLRNYWAGSAYDALKKVKKYKQ